VAIAQLLAAYKLAKHVSGFSPDDEKICNFDSTASLPKRKWLFVENNTQIIKADNFCS
jgi:hypothetical protein